MKSLSVKLGVFFIGFIILGHGCLMVNIANAEGAWVLWESSGDLPTGDEVPWHIIGAYPSYTSCRQNEEAICAKRASQFSQNIKDIKCFESWGGHTVTGFYDKNQRETMNKYGFAYEWKCLPDTIDPRK